MNHNRCVTTVCVTLAAMSFAGALLAQRGRGGGASRGSEQQPPAVERGQGNIGGPSNRFDAASGGTSLERLVHNPALSQRIQPLIPAGTDLHSAAAGFRNGGEFIAALHVSRNLGIPFDQLKSRMTGNGESLGKAIQALRPDIDSKAVKDNVKAAMGAANGDMKASKQRPAVSNMGGDFLMKPELTARLNPLLPAGMTMEQASAGFPNKGQFAAALHAARNLNIPYRDLRARMIAGGESLGEAIHALRPELKPGEIESGIKGASEASERDLDASGELNAAISNPK